MPAILDWRQAAAPDELARQISQALVAGSVVALPSEAGTVLAADPACLADPARPAGLPDTLTACRLDGFFDPAEFFARAAPTAAERALAARLWPGPVGWVHDDSPYPAWVPAHLAVAAVLAARHAPLALFELADGRPVDPAALGAAVAQVVTDGVPRPGPLTLVRPNDARWTVERPGVMTDEAIRHALARQIVFVCTGNTCRSPMAEGLFKQRLADRLGCAVGRPARPRVRGVVGRASRHPPDDRPRRESVDVLRRVRGGPVGPPEPAGERRTHRRGPTTWWR